MSEPNLAFKAAALKPIVAFAALDALDIRVGTITKVEEVPRSEKLMKLTVSFGDHSRTILAGMKKERENPREIEDLGLTEIAGDGILVIEWAERLPQPPADATCVRLEHEAEESRKVTIYD